VSSSGVCVTCSALFGPGPCLVCPPLGVRYLAFIAARLTAKVPTALDRRWHGRARTAGNRGASYRLHGFVCVKYPPLAVRRSVCASSSAALVIMLSCVRCLLCGASTYFHF